MRVRRELGDPWGMLIGGLAGGFGWAVGIPAVAAAGIGAAVWAVRAVAGAMVRGHDDLGPGAEGTMFDPSDVRESLRRLRMRIEGRVPNDIYAKVDGIAQTIEAILPRHSALGPGSQDLFVLARTAMDYLPIAIDTYLNLPQDYATEHPISGGKTAREILAEQLNLLQAQIDEVAIAVNKNDTDKLLAHGRFLEERFGHRDLSLGDEEGT